MKITIIGNTQSLLENYDERKDNMFEFGAKVMGVCINNNPLEVMQNEPIEKTQKRLIDTIKLRHHSGYDFSKVTFLFEDTSKLFITQLHNLHVFDSEGTSGRHVELKMNPQEKQVFDYFYKAFYDRVCEKNPEAKEHQKKQIAFENARYIIGADAKTNLVHQISLRQFNYVYEWAQKFLEKETYNEYEALLIPEMKEFCRIAKDLEIDGEKLINENLKDPYNRSFNMFYDGKKRPEHFGTTYEIYYKSTLPTFDQLQRHRAINYKLSIPNEKEYYIPQIVKDMELVGEWNEKIDKLENVSQARLLDVFEYGTVDQFVMKMKERCCEFTQPEAKKIVKDNSMKIFEGLKDYDPQMAEELILRYGKGKNRREFPDYKCVCKTPCNINKKKSEEKTR